MTRINTNVEALRGLYNLNKSQSLQSTALARLSTGLQINSGADNPSGLIASQTLGLQATTIQQSVDNSNRANNVLATADSALGSIGDLLNQVRGLVQQGLNVGALSADETQANQSQIDAALSAINRISANTSFAGDKLIDGSKDFQTTTTLADKAKLTDFQINQAVLGTNSSLAINATVNTAASQASLRYSGGALSAASTVEIGGSGGNQSIFLGASSTVANIQTAINNVADTTGVKAAIQGKFTQTVAATAATATLGSSNAGLTYTAATAGTSGNSVSITYVAGSGNNVATSVAVSSNAITVTLGTNGSGTVNATANNVLTAVQASAPASALVTVALASGSNGTGTAAATSATSLAGGKATGALTLRDNRSFGSTGDLSIAFVNSGNSQTLSASLGAANSNGDRTITVNLATNGSGTVTSTLDDINTLFNTTTNTFSNASTTTLNSYLSGSETGDATNLAAAVSATALDNTVGDIVLYSKNYGSTESVNVNVLNGTFNTTGVNNSTYTTRSAGTDISVTINGQQAQGRGLQASLTTASFDASLNFTTAANVAANTATVNVNGGGALFQIGTDATTAGQVGIGIQGVNTARLGGINGKLYELGTGGGKSLIDLRNGQIGSGTKVAGDDVVKIIDQALNRVNTLRGRIGALQKNVIETNISTLGVTLQNITQAKSEITDTDFAAETANLNKAQVLAQAGISVLSIANQKPQQVLKLLQ